MFTINVIVQRYLNHLLKNVYGKKEVFIGMKYRQRGTQDIIEQYKKIKEFKNIMLYLKISKIRI
jgi:hypothetical protein